MTSEFVAWSDSHVGIIVLLFFGSGGWLSICKNVSATQCPRKCGVTDQYWL